MIEKVFFDIGQTVIAPILFGLAAFILLKLERKFAKVKYNLKTHSIADLRINEILTELRVILGADRVYLTRFHNGDRYIDNSSVLKMSRTNEAVSPGTTWESNNHRSILVSLCPEQMKLITDNDSNVIKTKNLKDSTFKRILMVEGVKSSLYFPVKKYKDIIAFIGVDFCEVEVDGVNTSKLEEFAGRIEQILSKNSY